MSSPADATTGTAGTATATDGGAEVALTDIEHVYGQGSGATTAVGPVSLSIRPGEFVSLVGASGCGKSTLLRLIAGFERPTSGSVTVAGRPPEPGHNTSVVFQQPRLFPWKTVGDNVALALRWAGVPRADRARRVEELLDRVGLVGVTDRRIWQISGGQQQRVAIARALAADAPLILMDEPFAALDALTRERLQEDVRRFTADEGRTAVFVTHSVDEAVFLGSRVVVLTARPGQVALDVPVNLPRTGVTAEDLRNSAEYLALRADIGASVRSAAA